MLLGVKSSRIHHVHAAARRPGCPQADVTQSQQSHAGKRERNTQVAGTGGGSGGTTTTPRWQTCARAPRQAGGSVPLSHRRARRSERTPLMSPPSPTDSSTDSHWNKTKQTLNLYNYIFLESGSYVPSSAYNFRIFDRWSFPRYCTFKTRKVQSEIG